MKSPITRRIAKLTGVAGFFLFASVPSFPQQLISAKAGNIQFIHGEAFLQGTPLQFRDLHYIQMENCQVLSTGTGHVELLLAPDAYLRLDIHSSMRLRQNSLDDIQLELIRGSALIEILEKLKTEPIRLRISDSVIEMKKEGLYRIDVDPRRLRVYGGDATAVRGVNRVRVKNGRTIDLEGESGPEKFDADDDDAFHWWAAQRSFTLYSRNLFFTQPLYSSHLPWRIRSEGLYHPHYRVTVAANEDWNRYWRGVMTLFQKRAMEIIRQLQSDPGSLLTPEQRRLVP